MHYQISRNGQTYGPYTLEDLRRYLDSGNVLPNDLAKSDDMPEWLPVSQLLAEQAPAAQPFAATQPFATAPSAAPQENATFYPQQTTYVEPVFNPLAPNSALASSPYPPAPNLHWGLVLLFGFLSCYLFVPVWNLVIAAWLRRVQPDSQALFYYAGAYGMLLLNWFLGGVLALTMMGHPGHSAFGPAFLLRLIVGLAIWGVRLAARFMERQSLEEHYNGPEPVGLQLNPVMVFFFGGIYFQYHLNRINALKQAAMYAAPRAF